MTVAWVGTSGWQYRDWRGRFYPKGLAQSDWLPYFATAFPTVEVNNTFYRLPERDTFEGWRRATPDGFLVAVKASRYVTHIRRLRDAGESIALLWERAGGLGARLGPVLFQLPPNLPIDLDRLRESLRLLPKRMRPAFEFRHDSWETPETFELLDEAGAALVWPDRPGRRQTLPATGGWGYVRFHQGRRTSPGYTADKLRTWADRLASLQVREVFAYFNNDTGGAAVRDAQRLISLLQDRGVDVPVPGGSHARDASSA